MTQSIPQPGPVFQQGRVEVDGCSVRYRESGQGEPVVLLDGLSWATAGLQDALARRYRLISLQIPGFDGSSPDARAGSVAELARTTARAAAEVARGSYTLVGVSFGANVALWQALQAPEAVEALVLVSPTSIRPAGDPNAVPVERLLAHPENVRDLPAPEPAVAAQERALTQRLGAGVHDAEAEARLGEIRCATLVVFGSLDRMVEPQTAGIYREHIPNCNVSLVYDTGHAIAAERPEALSDLLLDFVERRETFIVGRRSGVIHP